MDVAALALNIDSTSVVKATADLDRFSAASDRAKSASGSQASSIARLVASVQSMDAKLSVIVGSLEKIASASRAVSAANDNTAASTARVGAATAAADAHIVAYTQHLAAQVAAQKNVNAAMLQADAHVVAYRTHMEALGNTVPKASQGVLQLSRSMIVADQSAGALKANTGNIAAQFQDIGVTSAMGMNPLIIALQQGTQLSAVFAQSGGSALATLKGAFASVFSPASLLTIAIVALVAVVIQLGIEAFNTSSATAALQKSLDNAKLSSSNLSDGQSILGNVFELTTGKIKDQTEATIALARAQAMQAKIQAQIRQQEASKQLDDMSREKYGLTGGAGGGVRVQQFYGATAGVVDAFKSGSYGENGAVKAEKQLERMVKIGQATKEEYLAAAAAIANFSVETANITRADKMLAAISGDKGALKPFLNLPGPKKAPKGPKSDAEKLADVYASATADIAIEKARGLASASNVGAEEAARLEKQTALLNSIQQKGIPITDAVRQRVAELAGEYAKLKVAADVTGAMTKTTDEIERQGVAVADQAKLIGLYGPALARATREMEAQQRLRDSLPKGEIVVPSNLTGGLSDDIDSADRLKRAADLSKASKDAAYAMDLERKGLGLTGAAALAYAYTSDILNQKKREGINLGPAEVAAIKATGDAYGAQRYAIDQQAQAMADSREITRGFFSDFINGARESGNVFKSFADSAINSLNRIIEKLLDKTLTGFFDGAGGGGGGFLARLLGGGSAPKANPFAAAGSYDFSPVKFNALGGVYGAQRFAKGGAFTNTVVNTPTLFRFAKGAKMGEMGEAGPEAIMPLTRGPNGSLGVQMHGGSRPAVRLGDTNIEIKVEGGFMPDAVMAVARRAGEEAVTTARRSFDEWARDWDQAGGVAS